MKEQHDQLIEWGKEEREMNVRACDLVLVSCAVVDAVHHLMCDVVRSLRWPWTTAGVPFPQPIVYTATKVKGRQAYHRRCWMLTPWLL